MKQLTILSGRCLVVELPEGANRFTVFNDDRPYLSFFVSTETPRVYLPPGNWHIVGMLSEVTEEQAATFVKLHATIKKYKDYLTSKEHPTNVFTKTALESLESSILAEGYTFSPVIPWLDRSESEIRELESRVLCRERCLLLGREG